MKTIAVIIFGLIISGCASVEQISMKDGKPFYQANCRHSQADCHKLAAQTCNGEYQIFDTMTEFNRLHMTFSCK